MKKIYTWSFVWVLIIFTGCSSESVNNTTVDLDNTCELCPACELNCEKVSIEGKSYTQLKGTITSDLTLTANEKWLLVGPVFVDNGAHLTIEAGTTIYANNDSLTPFLSILQGGYIQALGTAEEPIVFTSIAKNPEQGDWGGIILNGYAPIQDPSGTAQGKGNTGVFGGNNSADNSGILSHIRVEYAGKELVDDYRMNGFTFNGCGSGTTLDHLQAYYCKDDGFEFEGGTVGLKYAIATACGDDGFDYNNGWQGKGQFWIAELSGIDSDRGIEGDNNEDNNLAEPCSNPIIANVTLIGADDGDGKNQGIKLRNGTKGLLMNVVVTGFPKYGIYVQHSATLNHINKNELSLQNSIIDNVEPLVLKNDDGEKDSTGTSFTNEKFNNTFHSDGQSVDFLNGIKGTEAKGAVDPKTLDNWFISAPYIGALPKDNDWIKGWTRDL